MYRTLADSLLLSDPLRDGMPYLDLLSLGNVSPVCCYLKPSIQKLSLMNASYR